MKTASLARGRFRGIGPNRMFRRDKLAVLLLATLLLCLLCLLFLCHINILFEC